jgi:16S rRNA processing protein RimM
LLGRITGAHGIRGEVALVAFTGEPEAVASYGALTDAEGRHPVTIASVRRVGKRVVATINGVRDRTAAQALAGRDLYIDRSKLPAPEDGAYYHADLIGLAAITADGHPIGRVAHVHNYGAGDILEIEPEGGGATEMIPFTDAVVPMVDLQAGLITIVRPHEIEVKDPDA